MYLKPEDPIQIEYSTFDYVFDKCILIVPKGSIEKYQHDDVWRLFYDIVEGTDINTYEQVYFKNYKDQFEWDSTVISDCFSLNESSIAALRVETEHEMETLSYSRDFTNTNWQPMYVPFKISAEELEAAGLEVAKLNSAQMIDEDADGNAEKMQINFLRVKSGSTLPNKPYLVRAKTTGEHTVEISDATIYKTTVESVDCSTTEMEFTFTGTYEGVSGATILENNYYVMSKGTLCTAEDSSSDLKAFRWYMSLTPRYQYGTQVPRTRALISIDGENATTDIEDIFDKEDSRPDTVHISSQIIGLKPGEYRMNGKKMVVE